MSASTGPMLAAGGITWANQVLLDKDDKVDVFTETMRIALATGVAASMLFFIEQGAPDFATALAWAAVVTVLFVRIQNNPTPAERILSLLK